jgi:prepilin-type N-terminal cleavage/methylation domain-containing protein
MIFKKGVTLIELLIALVISSMVIGAVYGTFGTVSNIYHQKFEDTNMQRSAYGSLKLMSYDIKMANYNDLNSTFGPITQAIFSADNLADVNGSDGISIVYDESPTQRIMITYRLRPHLDRKRLVKSLGIFDGTNYSTTPPGYVEQVVADYVEDLQFVYHLNGVNQTIEDRDLSVAEALRVVSIDTAITFRATRAYERGAMRGNEFDVETFTNSAFIRNIGYFHE